MSASNESYRQYKLIRELQEKVTAEYVNDYSNVDEFESCYCDLCDRQLVQYDADRLVCPACQILIDTQFTIVRRKPTRSGPVDLEDGNEQSNISEYYNFTRQKEKEDNFVTGLKAKGYQIVSSSKK